MFRGDLQDGAGILVKKVGILWSPRDSVVDGSVRGCPCSVRRYIPIGSVVFGVVDSETVGIIYKNALSPSRRNIPVKVGRLYIVAVTKY